MLYLFLSVLMNTFIAVIFKVYSRFRLDTLQVIVVNYWVCVITGSIVLGHFPIHSSSFQAGWFPYAAGVGIGFVSLFNLIAYCVVVDGITTTTISNKLSLAIPVIFALFLYHDSMSWSKGVGIALAFPAVYLATRVRTEKEEHQKLFWPMLLFLGSGLMDTTIIFAIKRFFTAGTSYDNEAGVSIFLTHAFAVAGTAGLLVVGFLLAKRKATFSWKNIIGGIILGIPNYFSVYWFLQLLHTGFLQSSAALPINNIGAVLCASLCAIIFFKEKAALPRILGLALSITAILLIALSDPNAGTP